MGLWVAKRPTSRLFLCAHITTDKGIADTAIGLWRPGAHWGRARASVVLAISSWCAFLLFRQRPGVIHAISVQAIQLKHGDSPVIDQVSRSCGLCTACCDGWLQIEVSGTRCAKANAARSAPRIDVRSILNARSIPAANSSAAGWSRRARCRIGCGRINPT
jgi:hypothetical protein